MIFKRGNIKYDIMVEYCYIILLFLLLLLIIIIIKKFLLLSINSLLTFLYN